MSSEAATPESSSPAIVPGYSLDVGASRIARLTFDLPGKVNVMNDDFMAAMDEAVTRLEADRQAVRGVVIASAKRTFFAGGDLKLMGKAKPGQEEFLVAHFTRLKGHFRRLEKLGVPVVAALGGSALGGGLELALACHHRIAIGRDGVLLGLPEVGFGILPGAGGVVRLTALVGLPRALDYLLSGKKVSPQEALQDGIVDAVVDDASAMFAMAEQWIMDNPAPLQPWDAATPRPKASDASMGESDFVRRRITEVAEHSLSTDIDTALHDETVALVELIVRPETAELIGRFFARGTEKPAVPA